MQLACVPAGEFKMGSEDGDSDEKPVHTVYLDAYWIDLTEVTNAMFQQFILATGYRTSAENEGWGYVINLNTDQWEQINGADWQHPRGSGSSLEGLEQHPVVQVSWEDAAAYCEWAGRRLPNEAQWEKAARGTDERTYPWGNNPPAGNLLNFADQNLEVDWANRSIDDGWQYTAPVGSYPAGASPYGALDLAGNVWEWAADRYADDYYASSPLRNPGGPALGAYPVLRGGSWDIFECGVRSADRYGYYPPDRLGNMGFRCSG
jgi:formylglycine-generating enzyme required for sulfatase activity